MSVDFGVSEGVWGLYLRGLGGEAGWNGGKGEGGKDRVRVEVLLILCACLWWVVVKGVVMDVITSLSSLMHIRVCFQELPGVEFMDGFKASVDDLLRQNSTQNSTSLVWKEVNGLWLVCVVAESDGRLLLHYGPCKRTHP